MKSSKETIKIIDEEFDKARADWKPDLTVGEYACLGAILLRIQIMVRKRLGE